MNEECGNARADYENSARVPIGMAFLGKPFDEGHLIRLAFAWEMNGLERRWPCNTPPLTGEAIDVVPD